MLLRMPGRYKFQLLYWYSVLIINHSTVLTGKYSRPAIDAGKTAAEPLHWKMNAAYQAPFCKPAYDTDTPLINSSWPHAASFRPYYQTWFTGPKSVGLSVETDLSSFNNGRTSYPGCSPQPQLQLRHIITLTKKCGKICEVLTWLVKLVSFQKLL